MWHIAGIAATATILGLSFGATMGADVPPSPAAPPSAPALSPPSEKAPAAQPPGKPPGGVAPKERPATDPPPTLEETAPADYPGLHNVVAYATDFYSGGVPEGQTAFDTLKRWGVRTIISVDGAMPELEAAKARGIRYVHLPIGYNGFDEERKLQLARAVRDLEKPIYLHCHHGKHRSAGAAGTVAVSLGWLDNAQALGRMKVSGTAKNYTGLFRCTEQAAKVMDAVLDRVPAEFPEISKPSGMVDAMVHIDEVNDHLKLIEKAGWKAPGDHPDLVPVAEAGRLVDLFRVLHQDDVTKAKPTDFAQMLASSESGAQKLEDGLTSGMPDVAALSATFKAINASCKECHSRYRD